MKRKTSSKTRKSKYNWTSKLKSKSRSKSRSNTKTKSKFKSKYIKKGGNSKNEITHLFETPILSIASNTDPRYIEKGILYFTSSIGINILRDAGTALFNLFGQKGFEGKSYELCKLECLIGLAEKIPNKETQKLCNVKIDVETNNKQTIFAHGYGQLYELKDTSNASKKENSNEINDVNDVNDIQIEMK